MKFSDCVNLTEMQALCESFTRLTGAVTAILDLDGNILIATGWQPICTQFHRVHRATAQRCRESDTVLACQLRKGQPYNVYQCKNGLVDVAVPIRIGGEHVANFFTGQFFFHPPDMDYFRRQAEEFGFDPVAYLDALARTPVFAESHVQRMMDFLGRLVQLIGETGLTQFRLEQANEQLSLHRDHLEQLITERTRELLHAKEAAETASLAKSAFLANMSHELRTPLNAITGLSYLVRQAGVTPKQDDQLDKINAAGWHLLRLIDSILDLAKIEAGKFELEQTRLEIPEIIQTVLSMTIQQACSKGLSIDVDNKLPQEPFVGDPTRLRQALLNLVSNAIKFTETGGIIIRTAADDRSPDYAVIRFSVQDSGIGIEPEQLPRLFTAFEQVDNAPTRKHGGTGLGLAITKRLATLMGGGIGVESVPGKGSTFWFTARLKREPFSAAPPVASDYDTVLATLSAHYSRCRLLLVDDDPINLEVARELLSAATPHIDTATNGQDAVTRCQHEHYSLILMDVQMPVMDGLASTRAIRALPGYGNIPILALTANAYEDDRLACKGAGMDDFIPKPVRPESLYETVLRWLSRE